MYGKNDKEYKNLSKMIKVNEGGEIKYILEKDDMNKILKRDDMNAIY